VRLSRRFKQYYSQGCLARSSKSSYICRALKKHGVCKFSLEILEYCDIENNLAREQYFMDLLKPQYNILSTAGSSTGYKHTEESRAKISACQKGIPRPEATRAKISAAMKGIPRSERSEVTRAKISASQPNSLQIEVTDLELNTSTIYKSINEAARAINCDESSIRHYFKRNQRKPYKKRYVFTKHS
jgi:group I intron endonuclease